MCKGEDLRKHASSAADDDTLCNQISVKHVYCCLAAHRQRPAGPRTGGVAGTPDAVRPRNWAPSLTWCAGARARMAACAAARHAAVAEGRHRGMRRASCAVREWLDAGAVFPAIGEPERPCYARGNAHRQRCKFSCTRCDLFSLLTDYFRV
jgi:hypothetical protein